MNVRDLMVKDWVLLGKKKRQCYNICGHTNNVMLDNGVFTNVMNLNPIPLTPEILEKNGFEEKTESNLFVYYLFKDGDNSVSLEHTYDTTDKEDYWACSIGNRLCDVCTISMHYIHELQHALRLCGIDKEIVL